MLDFNKGRILRYIDGFTQERFLLSKINGQIKIVTCHAMQDTEEYCRFNLSREADGVIWLLDLPPMLIQSNKVCVIDEFDCKPPPLLTKKLIELFSERRGNVHQAQLIFSTQNGLLLDLKKFRRDELWLVDKNSNNESKMIRFTEYKENFKIKDIRRAYLCGRMNGVPNLCL